MVADKNEILSELENADKRVRKTHRKMIVFWLFYFILTSAFAVILNSHIFSEDSPQYIKYMALLTSFLANINPTIYLTKKISHCTLQEFAINYLSVTVKSINFSDCKEVQQYSAKHNTLHHILKIPSIGQYTD